MGKQKCRFRLALGIILTAGMLISGVNFAALPVYAEEGGDSTVTIPSTVDNSMAIVEAVREGLTAAVKEVAVGTRTNTTVEVFDLISKRTDGSVRKTDIDKLMTETGKIADFLLSDCQNDLFWYDKVKGLQADSNLSIIKADPEEDGLVQNGSSVTFSFTVSPDYQTADGDQYTVDSEKIKSAQSVLKSAQQIVKANADKSDYEKLLAYKNKICELVGYNTAAADPGYKKNHDTDAPWQMIYVFDNDPDTNVVCEGYSKAFQYLCDLSEFNNAKCYTVTGNMSGGLGDGTGGGHMWNIVTIGGKNYLVDVTNCDDNTIGAPDLLFLAAPASGSWNGSYTFSASGNNPIYIYSDSSKELFGESVLNLASEAYVPEKESADDSTSKPGTDVPDKDSSGSGDSNNGSDKDSNSGSDKDSNNGSDKDSNSGSDKDSNNGSDKDSDSGSDKDSNDDSGNDSTGTDSNDQTGDNNIVSGWTVETDPSDPNTYRLDVSSTIEVSDELLSDENLNTPEKIENVMRKEYQDQGISDENIKIYDVALQIYENGVWQKVTAENFPADGITIVVPYPSGTDNAYDFVASHLFTKSMNGYTAGQIERFTESSEIRKTATGISFTVHGLSPVSVGWSREAGAAEAPDNTANDASGNTPDTTTNNTSGNTPGTTSGNTSGNTTNNTPVNVSPRTGDFSPILLYMTLLILAVAVMGIVYVKRIYAGKR